MKKFKINYLTFIFIIISFFLNFYKELMLLYLFIFLHELGHLFFIRLFKYKIYDCVVMPYGMIININMDKNKELYKEIIIYSAGIFINLIFVLIGLIFNIKTFVNVNLSILIFNALPIIPLDGGRICNAFISYLFRYKISLKISLIEGLCLSLFLGVLFVTYYRSLQIALIFFYLVFLNIYNIKNFNVIYEGFLLGKYIYPNYYLKYKSIKIRDLKLENNFYKGKTNVLDKKNRRIYEHEVLIKKYKD